MASIALTKQIAAHRLILSGIRMVRRSEDPLAIHVVAASALNMLRELFEQGGPGYAARSFQAALFHAGLARTEGKPTGLPSDEALECVIDQIAAEIAAGRVQQISDIELAMEPGEERQLLDHILSPFNFLKHANRDPLATIQEEDVKPIDALSHAISAYVILFPAEELPPEVTDFLTIQGILP